MICKRWMASPVTTTLLSSPPTGHRRAGPRTGRALVAGPAEGDPGRRWSSWGLRLPPARSLGPGGGGSGPCRGPGRCAPAGTAGRLGLCVGARWTAADGASHAGWAHGQGPPGPWQTGEGLRTAGGGRRSVRR